MRRCRNSKIVATIGPASCDPENLERLFLCGVDVFRLNFSHGSHEGHEKVYNAIRSIGKKHRGFPTILADLQGPKLRVGVFENDKIILEKGDVFRLDLDMAPGNKRRVNLPHPEIFEALKIGAHILLDDGKLRFEVLSGGSDYAEVKVLTGGPLSNRKGVNVPYVMLPIPALTEKDMADLSFALKLGADWVALSFVQSVRDIEEAKKIINGKAGVISKLEKPLAIKALESIVEASDAIMIARGDLGVEMNPEDVPSVQRRIINTCHRVGRPVIVATQMLESMIASPSPTRAEASDIATAIYSGTDATMLSAESASGQYPFEAVEIMSKIITKTESDPSCPRQLENDTQLPANTITDAVCMAAKEASQYSCSNVIVLFANSFQSVVRCSRMRPRCPIILVTDSLEIARKAGLCYGVFAVTAKKEFEIEQICNIAKVVATEYLFASAGDNIVVINDISGHSVNICTL
ncbi:MAG: pyruvate kinase [Holosporaceae bacterium]|jgi:pyruvate kinase|nr:pyruvate kinase [Holosporaceae bacterium]